MINLESGQSHVPPAAFMHLAKLSNRPGHRLLQAKRRTGSCKEGQTGQYQWALWMQNRKVEGAVHNMVATSE